MDPALESCISTEAPGEGGLPLHLFPLLEALGAQPHPHPTVVPSGSPLPQISPCWKTQLLDKGASTAWFLARRAERQHSLGFIVSDQSCRALSASNCILGHTSLPTRPSSILHLARGGSFCQLGGGVQGICHTEHIRSITRESHRTETALMPKRPTYTNQNLVMVRD